MEKQNRELLEKVIQDRLTKALEDAESNPKAFEEAMKAIEKQNDIDKNKHVVELDKEKIKLEESKNTQEVKKHKRDILIKCVELGAVAVVIPLIDAGFKRAFAETICNFEKDYTFTTTAGRGLSSLFRWK
jgi:hypothetical protein